MSQNNVQTIIDECSKLQSLKEEIVRSCIRSISWEIMIFIANELGKCYEGFLGIINCNGKRVSKGISESSHQRFSRNTNQE